MTPIVQFHHIARLQLTDIRSFPPTEDGKTPFWARTLWLTDDGGRMYDLRLYSDTARGLVLEDRQARREWPAEALALLENLRKFTGGTTCVCTRSRPHHVCAVCELRAIVSAAEAASGGVREAEQDFEPAGAAGNGHAP